MRSKSISVLGHVSPTLTDFTPLNDVSSFFQPAAPYPGVVYLRFLALTSSKQNSRISLLLQNSPLRPFCQTSAEREARGLCKRLVHARLEVGMTISKSFWRSSHLLKGRYTNNTFAALV